MSGHEGSGKVWTVFKWMVALVVIGLIILWLIAGGWAASVRTAESLRNPINAIFGTSSAGDLIKLPGQPSETTRGPDISEYANVADQQIANSQASDQANQNNSSQNFDNPSPYVGQVSISGSETQSNDPSVEYVAIRSSAGSAIDVTGWSLQSAVSGIRMTIPQAAPLLVTGVINQVADVSLQSGELAIISTVTSPVGVSFKTNSCTGYLSQLQRFVPGLQNVCPLPSDMLPETADTLKQYGSACIDYVQNLPPCYFPQSLPSNLSSNCRAFLVNALSYNGCISRYKNDPSFPGSTWRLYLNRTAKLWNPVHDVIRLLDGNGQTVDALTY